ncbi:hypothetical protein D5F11_011675 [Siminovitchia terrae]|uniref:Peptidase C39-like domain-containing protein n=1 Tax=Siminovitchia terrae TaxID=1914933 RepID=A0A429X7V6_SIMTE|nr:C39 family peptidase [Siminovitchia terrae]RST59484.1 hypothetical protein D5F11_011675 [Siminovitchia terrae]
MKKVLVTLLVIGMILSNQTLLVLAEEDEPKTKTDEVQTDTDNGQASENNTELSNQNSSTDEDVTLPEEETEEEAPIELEDETIIPSENSEPKTDISNETVDQPQKQMDTEDDQSLNEKVEVQKSSKESLKAEINQDESNIKFYQNSKGEVTRADILEDNKIIRILKFHPGTKEKNIEKNVKFIFHINQTSGELKLIRAEELNREQKVIRHFKYYPGTEYGKQGNNISYIFYLNSNGNLTHAIKRNAGSQQTAARYKYYPNTKYGSHGNNIQYIFYFDKSSNLTKGIKRVQGSKKISTRYVYYPKTKYGEHGNNIRYIYYLNDSSYLTKATRRVQGSKKISARYEYYPKTKYGAHGNNIKYIFYQNTSGYLSKATQREKGSKAVLANYKYAPKTVYGKHASKITSVILNVPLINQLPELPTGCEITAVTMMLKYKGVSDVNKVKLAMEMPYHSWNPNLGYVGNPYSTKGWTIYPPALTSLVKKYAGNAQNLTGTSNKNLENQLLKNKPIVIWGSPIHGFTVHALVLTGYDEKYYYYNDCWSNKKDVRISKAQFNKLWNAQNKRAITY